VRLPPPPPPHAVDHPEPGERRAERHSEELQGLIEKIIVRLVKALTQLGYLVQEEGMSYLSELDPDNPLKPLQAASFAYPIALWPRTSLKG